MADTSVYTAAQLASIKTSNDDYLANKFMYRELNKIKILVLGNNLLYGPGSGSNYTVYTYTSVDGKDYFALLLQKLQLMFPDCFIYYTRDSNSNTLTGNSMRYISTSDTYTASFNSITNTLFVSQTILTIHLIQTEINYNDYITIGIPLNVTYAPINNRKCWEITGNTRITFNQSFPATQINFVAVGGGQNSNSAAGGNGGGVVYGAFNISQNYTLTITIGSSDMQTTINGTDINITANGGSINGGTVIGSKIISSTVKNGGHGASYSYNNMKYNGMEGFNGPLISDLSIYVAGGGGSNAYYTNSGFLSYYVISAGGAGGGGGYDYITANVNVNGIPNTGGGAGGTTIGNMNFGGSGVVYLYI